LTQAQLVDRLEKLLFEDSLRPPKYDSTYVMRFRNSLVVSGVIANQGFGVDIEDKQGNALSYVTNTAVQYGLALGGSDVQHSIAHPCGSRQRHQRLPDIRTRCHHTPPVDPKHLEHEQGILCGGPAEA
jgi:hypothetical protein